MATKNVVIRNGAKFAGSLPSGLGDNALTKDPITKQVGEIPSANTSSFLSNLLPAGYLFVGNSSGVATPRNISGAISFNNLGVSSIAFDIITNLNISPAAGIVYTKLNLTGGIINTDINSTAAIDRTKIANGNFNRVLINNGSGVFSEASAILADRVLISDSNGIPIHSNTTALILSHLDVTSSIQTQLNNKLSFSSAITPNEGDLLGFISGSWTNIGIGTVGQVLTTIGGIPTWSNGTSNGLPVGGLTNEFLTKIDGTNFNAQWIPLTLSLVTDITATAAQVNELATGFYDANSSVQTQLTNKLNTALAHNALFLGNISNTAGQLAPGLENQVLQIISGSPTWQTFTPGTGSVTSVDVSGGATGLIFTGGAISTTGVITMSGTLDANNGGTGFASYTIGDFLYANTTSTLAKRSVGTNGQVLTVVAGLPTWAPGGNGTFASNISVVLSGGKTLGKYTNGQTIPSAGLTAEQVLNLIALEYIAPVFTSFSIPAQATTIEVGTTLTTPATFTWAITVNSGVVSTIDIFDITGTTTLLTNTPNDGTQSVALGVVQLNSNGAQRAYRGILHDTGTSPSDINSASFTITSRYLRFWAPVSATPSTSAAVRALPSAFQTAGNSFTLVTGTTLTKFSVNLPPGVTIVSVIDTGNLNLNITTEYVLIGTVSVNDAGGTARTYNQYEMNVASAYPTSTNHVILTN